MRFPTTTWAASVLGLAAVTTLAGTARAQCPAADSFEPNDDCPSASTMTAGTTTGLTLYGVANAGGENQDFFEVDVPTGNIVTVDILHAVAGGDIDLYLYDSTSPNCGGTTSGDYLTRGFTGSDDEQVSWANNSGSTQTYWIMVDAWDSDTDFDCNDYDMTITVAPDPCVSSTDDSFEENDTCGAAAALATGSQTGLFVSESDFDHYTINVPAGDQLTVDAAYASGVNADVDLVLYDDLACTNQVDNDFGFGGAADVSYTNATGSAVTVVLAVEVASGEGCNNYDLNVATAPDPCLATPDDSFEDNDDCASAVSLPIGTTTGLRVYGAASALDEDYYIISVPANEILTVDALFIDADGDIDLELFDDAACTNLVDSSSSISDNEQVMGTNSSGSAQNFYLLVEAFGSTFDCNDYDLVVSTAPDPCATAIDDGFEDNDTCGAAVSLAMGSHTGLFVSDVDEDFYTVNVPAGEIFTADVTYVSGSNADVDLALYDDLACTNEVDFSFSFGGSGTVEWSNATGSAATVVLKAEVDTATGTCNNYDLNLTSVPDACLDPLADDSFEDNDDCFNGNQLTDGLYPGLFVSKADEDFYEVQVANGDTLTVDALHLVDEGDVDLYLYDDQIACGDLSSYLDRGFTSTDNETVTWTNSSGSTATYYIQVVIWDLADEECNDDYDLQIVGSGGEVSTPFCFGDGTADAGSGPVSCPCGNESTMGAGEGCNSSLGFGAVLTSSGSDVVANDDLVFSVSQARANQPSMLVQGTTQVAFPFKDGVLCLGSPTERIEVVFLDASGAGSTATSIVTGGNVSPGDTRFYQQWYRDPGGVSPCGTGSNFSQGLIVNWQ